MNDLNRTQVASMSQYTSKLLSQRPNNEALSSSINGILQNQSSALKQNYLQNLNSALAHNSSSLMSQGLIGNNANSTTS